MNIEIKMGDLLKNLQKLPEKVQKRVVNGAIRASAKPIIKEARRRVPVKTGNLKKSIGVTKGKTKGTIVTYHISPRKGGKYDGFYGKWIEFGHIVREKGKSKKGKVIGHVPPHPFLRPAFEAKGKEAIIAFKEYMQKRLEKELAKE